MGVVVHHCCGVALEDVGLRGCSFVGREGQKFDGLLYGEAVNTEVNCIVSFSMFRGIVVKCEWRRMNRRPGGASYLASGVSRKVRRKLVKRHWIFPFSAGENQRRSPQIFALTRHHPLSLLPKPSFSNNPKSLSLLHTIPHHFFLSHIFREPQIPLLTIDNHSLTSPQVIFLYTLK